jgi:hypothetical protein
LRPPGLLITCFAIYLLFFLISVLEVQVSQ